MGDDNMMTQEELKFLIHERIKDLIEEHLHNQEAEMRQLVKGEKMRQMEQENEIMRQTLNNQGRRLTIEMLKAASIDWRTQWAEHLWKYDIETGQSIPLIPDFHTIGVHEDGKLYDTETGRYL